MRKTLKFKKNYEFNNAFKKGKFLKGKFLGCFYIKNNQSINHLGIAISSKLCNAVKRNRIKRVILEAYRQLEPNVTSGITIVFIWNKEIPVNLCKYEAILKDMINIFKKMGCYEDETSNDLSN